MSDSGESVFPISFTYECLRHGWAHASISDGNTIYDMTPSYVPTDPLFALMHAVVEVLRYSGDARCSWFYESATDHWTLSRRQTIGRCTARVTHSRSRSAAQGTVSHASTGRPKAATCSSRSSATSGSSRLMSV